MRLLYCCVFLSFLLNAFPVFAQCDSPGQPVIGLPQPGPGDSEYPEPGRSFDPGDKDHQYSRCGGETTPSAGEQYDSTASHRRAQPRYLYTETTH